MNTTCPSDSSDNRPSEGAAEANLPLLQALRGQRPARTPVWFMRQAGRSLPEYHRVRANTNMLQACVNPQMAAEITLQPVRRYGVDGAIFYSDIVVPLYLAGVKIDIVPGRGPVLEKPLRSSADIDQITAHTEADWSPITQAATLIGRELETMGTAQNRPTLLGFAGAPYTLASYLVEGGASKNQLRTRALIAADPAAWERLAAWCADLSARFLAAQVAGGVRAVQLFDSWAGSLAAPTYRQAAAPFSRQIFAHPALAGVPKIHFAVGANHLLGEFVDQLRPNALGVDWRADLAQVAARFPDLPLQGNLDPAVLFSSEAACRTQVRQVLEAGKHAKAHVFNLGHGVDPAMDPARLQAIVEQVHACER